ncbi:MAG: hypothetical protein D8M57_12025 [Candidatus Scalindua sp. AMX11]|nr:MAG: hypothetical protein DWQ00_01935 [Candidatus Scalindua sp.]TDE64696.1 MAG: hypothetical protein D8M57_12025 [Candidatus Scalindua sp. AMX11]
MSVGLANGWAGRAKLESYFYSASFATSALKENMRGLKWNSLYSIAKVKFNAISYRFIKSVIVVGTNQ